MQALGITRRTPRMPTPLNQSVADSALLTKSLPLGLLRAFVQTDAADDGLTPQLLAELKILARTPGLLVACNYGGTLCDGGRHLHRDPAAGQCRDRPPRAGRPAQYPRRRHFRPVPARSRGRLTAARRGAPGGLARCRVRHGLRPRPVPGHRSPCSSRPTRPSPKPSAPTGASASNGSPWRSPSTPGPRRRTSWRWPPSRQRDIAQGPRAVLHRGRLGAGPFRRGTVQGRAPWSTCAPVLGVSAALYAGDASSDELAMATLRGPDMALRVGEGTSVASAPAAGPASRSPGSWQSSSNCGGRGSSARTPSGWNGTR